MSIATSSGAGQVTTVAPVSGVAVGAGELWAPFKDLQELIERTVVNASPENIGELSEALKVHKPDFVSLLSTKPKSQADRDELKKGATEGIYLRGHESKKILQASIIQEALIMSDMFDINEFQALDLLTVAEAEQECHPGWGRGLLAVFMFYEGRAAMVSSFVSLLEAVPGFTWSSRVPKKVIELFQNFLNQVFQEDMVDRILALLSKYKLKQQIELLDTNLALGDWRHRASVIKFIEKIREGLGQIVFCWAAQRGLEWKDALRILDYLKTRWVLSDEFELEREDVLLITSLLYALDYSSSPQHLNRKFALELKKYCTENNFSNGFQCEEVLDLLKLAYFTDTYKLISETHVTTNTYQVDPAIADISEEDEFEFRKDMFNFLKSYLFCKRELFAEEEHVMRRFHAFFTDFITFLPLKVKDLKNRCEDTAKTIHLYSEQGLAHPPNLPRDYEHFLECMSLFYLEDELNLSSDYFSCELQYAYLNKFVRSATVDHPFMFIHNVKMLTGLAKGCSSGVFNLLKQNGHSLSLEHFFDSIIKYLGSFGSQVAFNGPSVYQSDTYQRVINDSMKFTVNPVEIVGICTYLDLIQVLCSSCTNVQHFFTTTKPHWLKVAVTAAKVRSIPREIRAKMLNAAAAMIARDSVGAETALNLWEMFYSVRLIDYGSGDLRDELEDRESRLESYSLTIGLLRLIDSLIDARFGVSDVSPLELNLNAQIDNGVLQPYVSFVRDSVLLKVGYRAYKSISERWELATLAMGILSKLLDYVPALMLQMLSDSPLHRMVLGALVDCMRLKEMSIGWAPHVDKCSQQCLQLIQRVLYRQHGFLYRRELSSGRQGTVVVGLHQLIMKVLPDTGKPDYLLSVVKFIDLMYPRLHRDTALDILVMILDGHGETDSHVYSAVTSESSVAAILRQTLCEFLDEPGTEGRVKNLVLQLVRSSVVHPSPNVALYLLGADKKVDFQNPGVQNYPRNVLHAILDNAVATPDAFLTLLILMRDSRLSASLLRYLRTNQYFVKILVKEFPAPNMETQCVGYFLKCVALELNHTKQPGPLAHVLVGQERGKFQEILEKIEMQLQTLEIPSLEFFDPALVIQAMKTCEYHDRELNTKIVRVDVLETLLRDEIAKLEKSTVLRLRKSVHNEAKELISFAKQLNAARTREASKVLMFDGWKQCLEILLLNPAALKLAGVDFVTSILRLILDKVRSTQGPSEYFLRLAAETTLTLCAVMRKLQAELKGPTLNVILNHLCSWVPDEQHAGVRTYLYASIHYVVDMIREVEGATTNQASFAQIIDHLCRDVSQASDLGRLQAMYLMGEIIRWTHSRNLGGYEIARVPSSPAVATPSRSALRPRETLIPGTPLSFREAGPNLSAVFSRPSPAASRSLLETTPSGRGGLKTPVRSKAVAFQGFGDSPGAQGGFNMSQGFNVSGSQGAFGASPGGQGFNVSGLQRSFASQSLSRSRLEDKENRSDSEDEEGDGDARHKSILDCTSQDIFDTSRAQAKDEGLGKVTTSRRLALGSSASKKEFEKASAMSSSQSILINHMHTKGYLRALVDALPIVDDPLLMQLFSERPDANRMRALLLFEGKMSLFSRMAWAGMQPTLYLVDVNTILRLADMSVFDINFLDEQDKAAIATRDEMSMSLASDFGGRGVPIPSRRARMETLFSSFLRFFIAMVTSAPKNVLIIDQIWHFITVHDYALATLISASVIHEDEYRSSAYMFTALMAKIAKRLHGNSFKIVRNKATVYTRMIGILKQQGMEHVSTENRLALVLNAMLFLYNHAFNVEAMKEEDGAKRSGRPCRVVLTRQLNLMSPKGNQDHEVPLGLVLKLARDSLHRIHVSTNISVSAKAAQCHASIAEIGLTLAYHHAEMFSRDPTLGAVEFGAGEIEQRNFQQELRSTVEEYFAIDLGLHAEPIPGNYTEVMLHRLRRLAHMPS